MTRSRLTLAVMLALTASYQLYAQWARSLTKAQAQPQQVQQRVQQEPVTVPPETFVEVAQQALPHVEWLRSPDYTYQRDNEFFIYASSFELTKDVAAEKPGDSGERIKLAPCVLIWINPDRPSATPYVVQCEAARVQFENPVELGFNAPSPGRLKAAAFDGTVEITGPDGLHLVGENFDFSEESRSLYSPHKVTFAYGPSGDSPSQVHGSALGVRVTFSPNRDPVKPEMPRIGGLERVRLLQKVVLDCQYEERADRKQPELAFAHISCDDALDFNAIDNEAILLSNVLVERPTGGTKRPDEADSLRCHQLSLRFVGRDKSPKPTDKTASSPIELVSEEARSPTAESPTADSPFGALRIKEVEALGTLQGGRAMLQSDKQRLTAHMQLMRFDVDTATAVLSDEAAVNVERDGTQLRCKTIRIARDPATNKQVLTCLGRGLLQHHDEKTGDLMLEAHWVRQLHAAPDSTTGLLLVHLDEDARLIVQERAGLRADHLALWIDDRTATEDSDEIAPAAPGTEADAAGGESQRMPLRFFEARGAVIVANSQMRAETELLQAVVEPGTLPHQDVDKTRQAAAEGQPDAADQPASGTEDDPWQISSRKVELWLLNPPGTRDVQVSEIVADGEVAISQMPAAEVDPAGAPVSLSGAKLHLINEGGVHQHVNVTGAPAMMRRGHFRLEGRDLRVDRSGNRATIVGEGLLQAPVDHDLNGLKLDQPMLLDVKWQEGMTFDGAMASFRKRVLLQLHDSVLQCDEMDVRLDRPIRFSDERPVADERPVLRDVSCRNGVHVEIYDWKENKIVGIRKGDLTQFLLDYQTGEFQGDGPGHVNHWSRSEGRRVAIAPPKAAQANVPVSSDGLDWEHISVEFDDLLVGNFKTRTARLHGRVQLIYAPVRRVSETFEREDLSGNSPSVEHAVWLGCNTLDIELHSPPKAADGSATRDDYLVITADNLCELEGQLFHAKADSLSYDESKVQFTLRGKGSHAASIYYQERPKADSQRIAGQIIQFFPSLQKVILEKSSGFQISQ